MMTIMPTRYFMSGKKKDQPLEDVRSHFFRLIMMCKV